MSAKFPLGGEFTIDGVSSDTWNCFYTAWHSNFMPSLRLNAPDIPGTYGKAMASAEWSSRIVSLDISLSSRLTAFADMQKMAAALDPTIVGSHKLILKDDNPNQYINVIPSADAPISPTPASVDFTLALEALDPFWYSTTPKNIAPGTVASGSSVALTNAGTAPAAPVITITRPGGASGALTGIRLTINGVTLVYNGTVAAGDTLVIDTGAMTVKKNGSSDIQNWSGDFPLLPVGNFNMTYSDTNAVGAVIVTAYTERWV